MKGDVEMTEGHADDVEIWGVSLPGEALTADQREYLLTLPSRPPSHEWVCAEMDRVWHSFGLDNGRPLSEQPIDAFYRHPVWLMNGIYSAADPASRGHRAAVAQYIAELEPQAVGDFGGGFGELARQISQASPEADVTIIEPYPSAVGVDRLRHLERVGFAPELEDARYDVVVAQDVLEHVEEPVVLASRLARAVRPGGHVVFANNFTPIIECHLPGTFHLRHTFVPVMRAMGLRFVERVEGVEHAQVFRVGREIDVERARKAERLSQLMAPVTLALGEAWRRFRVIMGRLRDRLVGSR